MDWTLRGWRLYSTRKDERAVFLKRLTYLLVVAVCLPCWVGCAPKVKNPEGDATASDGSGSSKPAVAETAEKSAPRDLLLKVLKKYGALSKYADEGILHLKFSQRGQVVEEKWPSRVQFDRAGKVAVNAFQATVRITEDTFAAKIDDEESNNLDNQVLRRSRKGDVKLQEFMLDPVLGDILASQLRRQPLQLELLLDPATLESVVAPGAGLKSKGMETFDGHACQLIELATPSGAYVFWVDPKALLVRRLDYPVATMVPDLATNPDVQGLRLSAELVGAKGDGDCAFDKQTFQLEQPANAKVMKSFVVPPRPLPSKLFGKVPIDFWFNKIGGERIRRDDLRGQISILVWFRNHPACVATLQQLEQARRELGEQSKVKFYAVNTDESAMSDEALQKLLFSWDVQLEPVRDFEAFGDKAFQIAVQPTVIVLGEDLTVQVFQPGGNPLLANQMVVIAERLQSGARLDEEILTRTKNEQASYEKLVAEGGPNLEANIAANIPEGETVLHQPRPPMLLDLVPLWQRLLISEPGNLYFTGSGEARRLLVVDGGKRIVEVEPMTGDVIMRHELSLPKEVTISYLREGKMKGGRSFFLAGAPGGGQLFWFDDQWKLLGSYPPNGTLSARIFDVCVIPQEGEDDQVAIGFGDLLGIHVLSTQREVLWKSRACPTVTSLARGVSSEEGEWLLAIGEEGEVTPFSAKGEVGKRQRHETLALGRLVNASFGPAKIAPMLGIGVNDKGAVFAVGLDAKMKDHWKLELPPGGHQVPIEPIVSGSLRNKESGDWLIASPDSCIHILGEDGNFQDKFAVGQALRGIAVGDGGVVVYSSEGRIDAVQVKKRP